MPRAARKKSSTGLYHVLSRGVNRQDIFFDSEDRNVYLERLSKYKDECGYQLHAYCLMSNHVHLLIREGDTSISEAMRRINTSYAYYFNWKYERTGHLFQDRFRSEAVEDDRYLMALVRYIHQNPVKIGMEISHWTSYNDFLEGGILALDASITDTAFILSFFNEDIKEAVPLFVQYVNEHSNDIYLDIEDIKRKTDEEASFLIKRIGKVLQCSELKYFEKETRDTILWRLKKEGLSIRQIERLTGINRGTVQKA